jgi:mono/diheme cytochrome c family protein
MSLALTVGVLVVVAPTSARAQALPHEPQYAEADITYGATLYAARCVTCHGPQGDAIGGVNLRTGVFKTAFADRDLDRVIRTGSAAGMPAFAVDVSTVKTGDSARGRALFSGKGNCTSCHRAGTRAHRQLGQHAPQRGRVGEPTATSTSSTGRPVASSSGNPS